MRICRSYAFVLALAGVSSAQQPAMEGKAATSQQSSTASTPANLGNVLETNIRAMWAAFKDKKKQVYGDYLWDDFTAVEEDGRGERNKGQVLREVEQSVVHDYKVQLFKTDPLGAESALVTYETFVQFPPGSAVHFEKLFISEIWLKRNARWKAWRYQATRVK